MTKVEKLRKEYHKAMLEMFNANGKSEKYGMLQIKCQKLYNKLQDEIVKEAKRNGYKK